MATIPAVTTPVRIIDLNFASISKHDAHLLRTLFLETLAEINRLATKLDAEGTLTAKDFASGIKLTYR